jgi:membrane-associated phospholipid phosphatase
MSGYHQLDIISSAVVGVCPDYTDGSFGSFLVLIDLFPILLWLFFFGTSVVYSEFLLLFMSLTLNIDYYVNFGLRHAFAQPPPTAGCGEAYEMPALATQQTAFIVTLGLLAACRWRIRSGAYTTLVLVGFVALTTYARIYIGFNSPPQLLAGAVVGFVHGALWFAVFYFLVHPHVATITKLPFVRNTNLRDTLCVDHAPRAHSALSPYEVS